MVSMSTLKYIVASWPMSSAQVCSKENLKISIMLGVLFLIPFLFNYGLAWVMYYWEYQKVKESQIPPEYPSFIPYLGAAIPFITDNRTFLKRVTLVMANSNPQAHFTSKYLHSAGLFLEG